ncbi:hypothetical protein PR048_023500 [Dryococelus australis]|uniref:Reverse transcriptase n=1 Tax=Dryococelus australis TaxID=614101 RepID=A0ABQ9GUE6_9NEOP|nr:hypothetical protein PR048_023500 [Dryococelus australis]
MTTVDARLSSVDPESGKVNIGSRENMEYTEENTGDTNPSEEEDMSEDEFRGFELDPKPRLEEGSRIKKLPEIFLDCILYQTSTETIPSSYGEAMRSDKKHLWQEAITKGMDALWVFSIKKNELDDAVLYKAKLVAKGFTQEQVIEFSPVVCKSSLR